MVAPETGSSVLSVLVDAVELPESLLTDRVCSTWLGVADRAGRVVVTGPELPFRESFFFTLAYRLPSSGPWVCPTTSARTARETAGSPCQQKAGAVISHILKKKLKDPHP